MRSYPDIPPIPADTARATRSAYSRDNLYLSVGDQLDILLSEVQLAESSSIEKLSRLRKPSLGLVTFFQYLEKLSDYQAAEATLTRIDWKYALHLSLKHPGLNPTDLCDFRQILLSCPDKRQDFQHFLDRLAEKGYTAQMRDLPQESLHVLAEICTRTRLDWVMTSMRNVLQELAAHHTQWLRETSLPYWYSRYEVTNQKPFLTESIQGQLALLEAIGADMAFLLDAIARADLPQLNSLKEIQDFYQVWSEQFDPLRPEGVRLYPYCYFCGTSQLLEGCEGGTI